MKKKQAGMGLLGMLLTMAGVIIVGVLTMRIVPIYIEHYTIKYALHTLTMIPSTEFSSDPATNAAILKSKLLAQLDIDNMNNITEQQLSITPKGSTQYIVSVKYQIIKPLYSNISIQVDFNDSQEVTIRAE